MEARIDHLVTAGNSDPDGPAVHKNNVWIVGDDREVIVIDPAHDAESVAEAAKGVSTQENEALERIRAALGVSS